MYEVFIGLEVHIHLLTRTKVFCGCRSAFGGEPNTNICPVCMGYPGVLPALNQEAMRMGCTVARALNCRIPERTWFDRKQYFYPDMTKNYQISQFASPLGQEGWVEIEGKNIKKKVRIRECHLEEDAGKMIHTGSVSLLDYNRAGVALLEIVTEPDMSCGEEAELFIQQLRRTVRYLGVCDGNMEEGSLRADANISINLPGKGLGKKVEIKNLNSSRFVKLGLNYERERQAELLDGGKTVIQETRLWNENRDQTEPMRTKENANDYRYFPEPDLPVFIPDAPFLREVEAALVELPLERARRFAEDYRLGGEQADMLCEEKALADYFEAAAGAVLSREEGVLRVEEAAQKTANWLLTDIKHFLSREGVSLADISTIALTPARLAELILRTARGELSTKNAKETARGVLSEDRDPGDIIKERGWAQISDPARIREVVEGVFHAEEAAFQEIRVTENKKRASTLQSFLVGKVLAATGGRANPEVAAAEIARKIAEP
jgi:aspartyl-tRNA(Asn)/glutamyl-tRNA(Gln) amidotransferase subunit B